MRTVGKTFYAALFEPYINHFHERYKAAALTSVLDLPPSFIKEGEAPDSFLIPAVSMDEISDYPDCKDLADKVETRSVGVNFSMGDIFDAVSADPMNNNAEAAGTAFCKDVSDYIRTKLAPAADAFRFSKYASSPDISRSLRSIGTGEAVTAMLRSAVTEMNKAGVSKKGRYLFIESELRGMVEDMDTTKSRAVMKTFEKIIEVPRDRFYTNITASGDDTGYVRTDESAPIYFMIIQKDAVSQFMGHSLADAEPPENAEPDSYRIKYRAYGHADICEGKAAGIYVCCEGTD